MNYKSISQENKAEILERAVLNASPEQLAETYRELGHIEMTARALGLACRFGGAEKVRTLIGCGATFNIPINAGADKRYHCYSGICPSGRKRDNYRSNFSLYLLKIFKHIKGACCMKGLKLTKQAAADGKKYLQFLPDDERLEVLRCLFANKDRLSFDPSEMLYHAIFARDEVIVKELRALGVELLDVRVKKITEGGMVSDSYCYEWRAMMSKLSDEDFIPVMETLAAELDGKPFYCTEKIYEITKSRFSDPKAFEFFCDHFRHDRLNKTKIIRGLIDENSVGALSAVERVGWLRIPKKRDELIEYAQQANRTECVAWLLDFKNRTADLAAERERAEKRMLAELNASPTSVTMMKKTWGFKKQENGSLIITNYKGASTEVIIPETIGKSTVTAIGNGAFARDCGLCGGRVYTTATPEQQRQRRMITKIVLPESVDFIGENAFSAMPSLTEINIPDGVTEIDGTAFYQCVSLEKLVIPDTVKHIGEYAFRNCSKLTAVVVKGSYAEEYCNRNNIKFEYLNT